MNLKNMVTIKEHDKIQEKLQILNIPVIIAMENLLLPEKQDHSSVSSSSNLFIIKQIWTLALYFSLLTETKKKQAKQQTKLVLNMEK